MTTTTDPERSPATNEPGRDHVDWERLRRQSVLPGGFGHERVSIWPTLLRVKPLPTPTRDEDGLGSHPDESQIRLDTERSFVFYPVGSLTQRYSLQAQLHALLVQLFRRRRKLSYFQGYHDITTVLLLTLPAPLLLPCTEKLSLYRLRDSMGKGLEPVLGLLRVLKNLLHLADPPYAALLEQTSPLPYYALSNLLTLFAHDMPTLPLIQHVFDWILCRPPLCVVYLGAAVILSRKAEVERLEEEGEEGMVHSLLSGLPELWDGEGEEVKIEEEEDGVKLEKPEEENLKGPLGHTSNGPINEDGAILPEPTLSPTPSSTSTLIATTDAEHISTADAEPALDQEALGLGLGSDELWPSPVPGPAQVIENGLAVAEDIDGQVELSSLSDSEEGTLNSSHTLIHSLSPSPSPTRTRTPSRSRSTSRSDSQHSSSPPTTPNRPTKPKPTPKPKPNPKIPLTSLLTHADALYAAYPPSHPSLCLSEIMGPRSVVFTWSEGVDAGTGTGVDGEREAEADDEAEDIVLHPELVVFPQAYAEPELPSPEEEEEKTHRRKPTKPKPKPRPKIIETRTMVVLLSAVLVLGVSLAVYGVRAGHHHHGGGGSGGSGGSGWMRAGWKKLGVGAGGGVIS